MSEDGGGKKKKGLIRRFMRLVTSMTIMGVIALFVGFKVQKGTWAWENPQGFFSYSKTTTSQTYTKVTGWMVETNREYQITDRTKALYDKAKNKLGELVEGQKSTADASTEATPADLEAERTENFGFTNAEIEQLPDGYFQSYKAGLIDYRQGLQAFRNSMPGTPDADEHLPQAFHQLDKIRIRFFVKYNKAGVHCIGFAI
jgi:hypothetical protein